VRFEKIGARGLSPIDRGRRLASLNDRIAALLLDLHLVAKGVAKRGAKKSVGGDQRKLRIGERRLERATRVLVGTCGRNLVLQPAQWSKIIVVVAGDGHVITGLAHRLKDKPAFVVVTDECALKLVAGIENQNTCPIAKLAPQARFDGLNGAREGRQATLHR